MTTPVCIQVLDSSSLDGVTFALTQRQKQLGSMIDAMNTTQFTAEKSKAYGSSGYTRYHATLNNVWTSGDLIAYDVLGTDSKDSSTKVVVPFINKLDVFPGCVRILSRHCNFNDVYHISRLPSIFLAPTVVLVARRRRRAMGQERVRLHRASSPYFWALLSILGSPTGSHRLTRVDVSF